MHFRRKRIVHFVIKQVAALFAQCNQRFYCFVFFFQNLLRHKLLPLSATVSRPFAHTRAQTGQISYLVHVQANARLHVWGGSPLTWFFVRTFLRRARCFSLIRTLPVIAPRWPVPAANRIYIDAVGTVSVTRETLLRYTGKSSVVNVLIVGNLWETLGLSPGPQGEC